MFCSFYFTNQFLALKIKFFIYIGITPSHSSAVVQRQRTAVSGSSLPARIHRRGRRGDQTSQKIVNPIHTSCLID